MKMSWSEMPVVPEETEPVEENPLMKEWMEVASKQVKAIFIVRIILWIAMIGITIQWIWYSFYLYAQDIQEVHEYAKIFRPYFYKRLIITFACIVVCLVLRSISDKIKLKYRGY